MFESAELGHKVDKATYDAEVPKLREALLNAQFDLAEKAKFPVIILIGGVDGAGRGETVNLLNEWMDPRHIQTHGMGEPSDEELERPMMWRFWRALPPKGKIGVFFGSWYTWPILNRVDGLHQGGRTRPEPGTRQALREDADRRRRADHQVLVPPFQGKAGRTPQGAGEESQDTLARHQARLGAFQALRQIPSSP